MRQTNSKKQSNDKKNIYRMTRNKLNGQGEENYFSDIVGTCKD